MNFPSLGILDIILVAVTVVAIALLISLVNRLQKQRALLDELFEQAPQAVALMSADYVVVRVNREFTQLFGYSPKEAIGRRLRELIMPDESKAEVQTFIDMLARGQRVDAESVRLRKDGTRLYISIVHVPISLPGGRIARYAIYRDITERKRAEESLKLFRSLIDQSSDAIDVIDPDTLRFIDCNESAHRSLGYSREEFLSLSIWDIDPALDQESFARSNEEIEKSGFATFESLHRRKDGSTFPVEVNVQAVRLEREYRLAVVRDITERKRAEERLRATTEQLRALSAHIHSAKEEEGTRIAREIHDELGAALTSLIWELESFDKVVAESGAQSQLHLLRERIEVMLRLTKTAIGTVRRISSELRPSILDDLGLVEAIEWQAQQFQVRTGITCRFDRSPGNLDLSREQSTAVFRILQEALTNILRHARATSVDITMKAEAGGFVLKIIDNGRGISENEKSGAQSLGLLGMQERAHLIGGKINVTGVEGKGTVITVRIPTSS